MLGILTIAELLGMTLWFAASAVSAQYAAQWSLSGSEAAWLTTIVQLGFVAGTAVSALFNVADIVPARVLFSCAALIGVTRPIDPGAHKVVATAPGYVTAEQAFDIKEKESKDVPLTLKKK